MSKFSILLAAAGIAAAPAIAQEASGDATAGERAFRQCQTCHVVENEDGEILAGRRSQTGPNLYGLPGRIAGSVDGFRYSDPMVAAGEGGLAWEEESFVAYVQDPSAFLSEQLGEKVRSKMSFRVRKEEDAVNLWAFLVSLSPEPES